MSENKKLNPSFNPFGVRLNKESHIKKVIAVVSGKGGVGKSLVSGLLANTAVNHGYFTGLLDADVTGPSIGRMFGIKQGAYSNEEGLIYPAVTPKQLKIMSSNMLLEDEEKAVMWRGIMINNAIKDFYAKVLWSDLDLLFVDMPPGTGDVPLTVYQSLPVAGIVLVTTPQDLVSMIVAKAIDMANKMNVPILGIIENMSYMKDEASGQVFYPFGESKLEEYAQKHNLKILARLPIDASLRLAADNGEFDSLDVDLLNDALESIVEQIELVVE
ncbi:MAG: Mrp/NBP35 family ATP-binding protein [Erysipelothrix sp.]|jgi:Mrp family chromosome partitioning ATPase|nr:Mrp/NBP35 family ATP-binding protein [Erysipelothrix sp.]